MEPLTGDRGISVYPFLFASGENISKRSRRPVPIQELWTLLVEEVPRQLGRGRVKPPSPALNPRGFRPPG